MSKDLVEALTKIDTPTVSNAIEALGVRSRASGFCSRELRQLTPEFGVMCGYAVTCETVTMTPETHNRDENIANYLELVQALIDTPKPAVVVFQETGGFPEFSAHVGEVMCTTFQRFGAVGVVSDSAVRDVAEVKALGLQLFAPGSVASHANCFIQRSQVPVTVCGVEIEPGDLLHGDLNGLLKIPEEGKERLPELVAGVREAEGKILDYLKGHDVTFKGLRDMLTH